MRELFPAVVAGGLLVLLCLVPAVGTARRLLGAPQGRALPLLRDRWQLLEQVAGAVLALVAAAVLVPWDVVPTLLWGLAAVAGALVLVGGALALPALPALAPDARGRLHPRTRVTSAVVTAVLAGAALALAA
ncbi:hypothetical protein [Pseudokineococcus sp. 1T1Z-3]|uniref:hypothetical protein n=1 Tax=Pseudokineococcus sp. 1T1Z-3 TaxID=3132745 RepID=UPI0030B66372